MLNSTLLRKLESCGKRDSCKQATEISFVNRSCKSVIFALMPRQFQEMRWAYSTYNAPEPARGSLLKSNTNCLLLATLHDIVIIN